MWRNGKSFAEASSALKMTSHTPSRVRQEVHRRLLAGPFRLAPSNTSGSATRCAASPLKAHAVYGPGLANSRIRYNIDRDNRLWWIWERVQRLNPELISLMDSLLGDRGHMIHVSPPAPGASLCLCVLLCALLLFLLFIVIYLVLLLFIYWGCCSVV